MPYSNNNMLQCRNNTNNAVPERRHRLNHNQGDVGLYAVHDSDRSPRRERRNHSHSNRSSNNRMTFSLTFHCPMPWSTAGDDHEDVDEPAVTPSVLTPAKIRDQKHFRGASQQQKRSTNAATLPWDNENDYDELSDEDNERCPNNYHGDKYRYRRACRPCWRRRIARCVGISFVPRFIYWLIRASIRTPKMRILRISLLLVSFSSLMYALVFLVHHLTSRKKPLSMYKLPESNDELSAPVPIGDMNPPNASACRDHVIFSSFKCSSVVCRRHRALLEQNTEYHHRTMAPEKVTFITVPADKAVYNSFNLPTLASLYYYARKACPNATTYTFINGDILLDSGFVSTVESVVEWKKHNEPQMTDFLVVGPRIDTDWIYPPLSEGEWDWEPFWSNFSTTRRQGRDFGKVYVCTATDYFIMSRNAVDFSSGPAKDMTIGRPGFDMWLVDRAYRNPHER